MARVLILIAFCFLSCRVSESFLTDLVDITPSSFCSLLTSFTKKGSPGTAHETEDQLFRRRLSTPRAATVVVLAAVVAAAHRRDAVVPPGSPSRIAGAFITKKAVARATSPTRRRVTLYLTQESRPATPTWQKTSTPASPIVGDRGRHRHVRSQRGTTAGYIPTAFTSFATKAGISTAVITFSGTATCTSAKPTVEQACPIQILVDGQTAGKVNFAPATAKHTEEPASRTSTRSCRPRCSARAATRSRSSTRAPKDVNFSWKSGTSRSGLPRRSPEATAHRNEQQARNTAKQKADRAGAHRRRGRSGCDPAGVASGSVPAS